MQIRDRETENHLVQGDEEEAEISPEVADKGVALRGSTSRWGRNVATREREKMGAKTGEKL